MGILNDIISSKEQEIIRRKQIFPLEQILEEMPEEIQRRSLHSLLRKNSQFHFICEIKKASPSKGVIQPDFNPAWTAGQYVLGGASAISVLTEEHFFAGKLQDLTSVRALTSLPLLRKDFIIDPYQIYESKMAGADAILLIAKILSTGQIAEFSDLAMSLSLDILFEIGGEEDVHKIPQSGLPVIIGINNRNLDNFNVDFKTSIRLRDLIPAQFPVIAESGIQTAEDCRFLYDAGFSGALIGETLMRSPQPAELLQSFVQKVNK